MPPATVEKTPVLPDAGPGPESLYEIVNGERREVPRMGTLAGTAASLLVYYLNGFAIPKKLGLAVSEVLFRLQPGQSSRRPDVAFVAYNRWPLTAPPLSDPPEFDFAPNLAVEIVSPRNTAEEIEDKIKEYSDAGVELVWVIFPRHRRIYVYESVSEARLLVQTDELDGGKVLPGFRLGVAALFDPLVKPA
jgi:Uma2 family endonuclease